MLLKCGGRGLASAHAKGQPDLLCGMGAQAHADQLHVHSQHTQSHPVMVQAVVQAQSFQAKAQSLEKAAEAQNLQARTPGLTVLSLVPVIYRIVLFRSVCDIEV